MLVLTHADKLDPPSEWAPPYDPDQGQRLKEQQMREARQAACEQLAMPLQQCALIAIRPGEPLWNREALEQAISGVLPEAQQKQLERGLADDGWFKKAKDAVISVPTVYDKVKSIGGGILGRTVRKTAGRLFGKNQTPGS